MNKNKNKTPSQLSLEPLSLGRSLFLALLNKNPESSGYDLMHQVLELTKNNLNIQSGSIYPTLRELEKSGFVTSIQQTSGRKRRLYTITNEGRSELFKMGKMMRTRMEILLLPLLDLIDQE
ncbi:MAG: PadR family transcriptional regulator [Promethearchaeota archaeon]